jgi:hypothetical protein
MDYCSSLGRGHRNFRTEGIATNGASGLPKVRDLGFPVDLLRYFPSRRRVAEPANYLAHRPTIGQGESGERVNLTCKQYVCIFENASDFKVADETGESEIGLLLLQIGGNAMELLRRNH